jgi:hypothetical protein
MFGSMLSQNNPALDQLLKIGDKLFFQPGRSDIEKRGHKAGYVIGLVAGLLVGGESGAVGESASGGRVLYRIITEAEPEANFLSNAAKGLPPRGPEMGNPIIYNGLSTFDTLEAAQDVANTKIAPALARRGRKVLGYAKLHIPSDTPGVNVTKTLGPGHYTVTGGYEAIEPLWFSSIRH